MRISLQSTAIGRLQGADLVGLSLALIDGKVLVNEQIPDFLPALAGIESFKLRITHPPEGVVHRRRLCSIALTHQLDDPIALINLLPQNFSQIAAFGAENVQPHRFVTEKGKCVGDELPGAPEFPANSGDENKRT